MHKQVKVKFCGMTNIEDAQRAVELGLDYIGFIIEVEISPRSVSLSEFKQIATTLKRQNPFMQTKLVGVIMNKSKGFVTKLIESGLIDIIQFHGAEGPEFCGQFKKKVEVWKAFAVDERDPLIFNKINFYAPFVDRILLDKPKSQKEFTDFDFYKRLKLYKVNLILAGGLNLENINFYLKNLQPDFVDLVSGIEVEPRKKDHKKMQEFINLIQKYNAKNN